MHPIWKKHVWSSSYQTLQLWSRVRSEASWKRRIIGKYRQKALHIQYCCHVRYPCSTIKLCHTSMIQMLSGMTTQCYFCYYCIIAAWSVRCVDFIPIDIIYLMTNILHLHLKYTICHHITGCCIYYAHRHMYNNLDYTSLLTIKASYVRIILFLAFCL